MAVIPFFKWIGNSRPVGDPAWKEGRVYGRISAGTYKPNVLPRNGRADRLKGWGADAEGWGRRPGLPQPGPTGSTVTFFMGAR